MSALPSFDSTYEGDGKLTALPFLIYTQPERGNGMASVARYTTSPYSEPGVGVLGLIDSDMDNAALMVTAPVLDDLIQRLTEFRDVLAYQAANA